MNINFDKFFEFLKEWSVGRVVVLLPLLSFFYIIISDKRAEEFLPYIGRLVLVGVFLEVFELSANHLQSGQRGWVCAVSALFSCVGLLGIIAVAWTLVAC